MNMEPLGDWRRNKFVSDISSDDFESEVTVAGWIQDIRNLGGIAFILLRDRTGVLQLTAIKKHHGEDFFRKITTLARESVIVVKGKVQPNEQVASGFEILPCEFKVVGVAKTPLPLGVVDKVEADMDTRLDSRFIDLRKEEIAAVFKIRSTILAACREVFEKEGFIEVHTPKIVATATEGGTALFQAQYFEKKAYLNQSPQLYKQMLMATGFDRVYEIGPAFRAEEHDTTRHLNEFTSIDIEMAFADEEDAMGILEKCVYNAVLKTREVNESDMRILGTDIDIPALPLQRVTYSECLDIIKEGGYYMNWGEDFPMEAMKILGERIPDFFFITKWPTKSKPFYTQPFEDNPEICRGFDLQYKEKEITSGAQRVSDVNLLKRRLEEQGLNPKEFKFYLDAFEYGMPPHAGWGLGAERLTMIITGMQNIRECVLFPRDRKRLVP
ncbi:MAG: aspartate--tRNA(Asn) ligase [Methanomassiliicoccales archaeon]|nr:MAG: aspartate--tRNA(Asn) ligase [Methanomassiliicoccales archaeon]